MVKIAIRDDDMNFFTKVEDIEFVYRDFANFPISFAVIPRVIDVSTTGACSDTNGNIKPQDVAENKELINWLRNKLKVNSCDVLLHGIWHSYKFEDGKRLAEMQWRDNDPQLFKLIKFEKERLSTILDYSILCFVAPSNKITRYCLKQVANAGLNFSGIIPLRPNVDFTLGNFMNYVKRWFLRFFYKLPYPGILKYNNHMEVNACLFQSYDYLVKMYNFCEKYNYPMVINVHYWHLRDNPKALEELRQFVIEYAIPRGAIPTKLTDLFLL